MDVISTMELTQSFYKSIVPKYRGDCRYVKIEWSDVTDLDKIAHSRASEVHESLEFDHFEYKGERKPTRIDEHVIPGHEGIRVSVTAVFRSSLGQLAISINPSNYNLFTACAALVYDVVSPYPIGFSPAAISTSSIIRDYWVGRFKLHPELMSEYLYGKLLSPQEINRAKDTIVRFDQENTDLTNKLRRKLRDLEYGNEDPEKLLFRFRQIATNLVPHIVGGLDLDTALAIVRIAYSHSSEIKNIRDEDIKEIAAIRLIQSIHGDGK